MKKVQIALTAVAMFAVIGGALAFKARSQNFVYVHATNDVITDRCTLQSFFLTATNNGATPKTLTASSIPVSSGCKTILVYPAQ